MQQKYRFLFWRSLLVAAVFFSAQLTRAQGIRYTKPLPPRPGTKAPAKPQATITVSADLQRNYGYCPVVIEYRTPAPTVAEQEVTVQVSFGGRRGMSVVQCEKTFMIPSGATGAVAEMLVPKYTDWHRLNWEVWIDGRRDESLSATEDYFAVNVGNSGRGGGGLAIMLVTHDPRTRDDFFSSNALTYNGATVTVVSLQELPQHWLAFTGHGAVAVHASDFEMMIAKHPQSYAALMRWVRTGGNLWIFACQEDWGGWQGNGFDRDESGEDLSEDDDLHRDAYGWRTIKLNNRQEVEVHGLIELSEADRRFAEPTAKGIQQALRSFNAQTSKRIFYARSHGMGTVTAFLPTHRPQATVEAFWLSSLSGRMLWQLRSGNAPSEPNYEFNNFLIPGVGLAPVTEFQLLITLFVLAIGPLNYWLLRRAKKLPWLLVTTPVSAGLLTLFLFGYGLFADGTGIRVRARSVTLLDQTAGEAASWARLSYYAGIAPREGLTVPEDTALYPIGAMMTSASNRYWRRPEVNREMQWSPNENGELEQKLTEGWLASRSPTQYLSVTSRVSGKRLDFSETAEGLSVTNNLGVDVQSLAVEDLQGDSYWCDALAAGETLSLTKTTRRDQATKLRKLFLDNEPTFPPGGEITQRYRNDRVLRLSDGLLEAEISAVISPIIDGLGRGRYVAITSKGIQCELGAEDAQEESSFHVLKGRYAVIEATATEENTEDENSEDRAEEQP